MKKIYITVFKIFLLMIVIQGEVASNEKIKIGLIVPLSGEYSYIGKSILKSTRMALNKIDDQRITIIPKDTRAIIQLMKDLNLDYNFFKTMDADNKKIKTTVFSGMRHESTDPIS